MHGKSTSNGLFFFVHGKYNRRFSGRHVCGLESAKSKHFKTTREPFDQAPIWVQSQPCSSSILDIWAARRQYPHICLSNTSQIKAKHCKGVLKTMRITNYCIPGKPFDFPQNCSQSQLYSSNTKEVSAIWGQDLHLQQTIFLLNVPIRNKDNIFQVFWFLKNFSFRVVIALRMKLKPRASIP